MPLPNTVIIQHDNNSDNFMRVKDTLLQTKPPYRLKVYLRKRGGRNSFPEDDDFEEGTPINVWAEGISQEDWFFLRDYSSSWLIDQDRNLNLGQVKDWFKKNDEIGDRIVQSLGYSTDTYELGGYFRFGMDPKNLHEIKP